MYSLLCGVGFVVYPWDLISQYVKRPRTPISKSDFIRRGRRIMEQARDVQAGLPSIPSLPGRVPRPMAVRAAAAGAIL